jgi:transposase
VDSTDVEPHEESWTENTCGDTGTEKSNKKRKGHGRIGSEKYIGAELCLISHETLNHGDPCPTEGCDGRVYKIKTPGTVIRVTGGSIAKALHYVLEKLRCNLCTNVFTARLPAHAGTAKYTASFNATLAVSHYGLGLPFNRLEKFHRYLGIPLPKSTQFECIESIAGAVIPVHRELMSCAAYARLHHTDDTTARIMELTKENKTLSEKERRGTFTTGIISHVDDDKEIHLFFTGRNHAGENLNKILSKREDLLSGVMLMCDALSRNISVFGADVLLTICFCIVHARRKFYECLETYPEQCSYVLEAIGKIYKADEYCKNNSYSPKARLTYHQKHSGPIMEALQKWLLLQIDDKNIEPNSSLGKAIRHMLKHWEKLTMFLKYLGAPLDNNSCERLLKAAICYRKNSLHYKTLYGAFIGDVLMSVIFTAQAANINPINYLTVLQQNTKQVLVNPKAWLPWNYQQALIVHDITLGLAA